MQHFTSLCRADWVEGLEWHWIDRWLCWTSSTSKETKVLAPLMPPEILNFQPAHEVNNFSCKCYQALFYPLGLRLQPHPLQPAPPRCRVHLHSDEWSVSPLQTETSCAQHLKIFLPLAIKRFEKCQKEIRPGLSKPYCNIYCQWALNFWLIKCVRFGSEFVFFRWRMYLAATFPLIFIWCKCQPH